MKIGSRDGNKVMFSSLKAGDVFTVEHQAGASMRVGDTRSEGDRVLNAVHLVQGWMYYYLPQQEVTHWPDARLVLDCPAPNNPA